MRHLAALFCGALLAGPAHALRCGGDVVSEGDSVFALTAKCGNPTAVERVDPAVVTERAWDPWRGDYRVEYAVAPHELWFYNFGPRRLVARITVRDGKILRIQHEGYGY